MTEVAHAFIRDCSDRNCCGAARWMGRGDDAFWNGRFALRDEKLLTSRQSWLWWTGPLPGRTSLGLRPQRRMRMRRVWGRLCPALCCAPRLCRVPTITPIAIVITIETVRSERRPEHRAPPFP